MPEIIHIDKEMVFIFLKNGRTTLAVATIHHCPTKFGDLLHWLHCKTLLHKKMTNIGSSASSPR
jgi:hypothetical protein